jgi:hypothetical protein
MGSDVRPRLFSWGKTSAIALARLSEIGYKRRSFLAFSALPSQGLVQEVRAMMKRICLALMFALVLLAAVESRAATQAGPLDSDTMKVALHTATAQENGFIDKVLTKVNEGVLPLDMVQSTFLWAKKKPRRKYEYFKIGIIYRAKQAGVSIQ